MRDVLLVALAVMKHYGLGLQSCVRRYFATLWRVSDPTDTEACRRRCAPCQSGCSTTGRRKRGVRPWGPPSSPRADARPAAPRAFELWPPRTSNFRLRNAARSASPQMRRSETIACLNRRVACALKRSSTMPAHGLARRIAHPSPTRMLVVCKN